MTHALIIVKKKNQDFTRTVLIRCDGAIPNKQEALDFLRTYGDCDSWREDDLMISEIKEIVELDYDDVSYNLSSLHSWPTFKKQQALQGMTVVDFALLLGDNVRISLLDENFNEIAKYNGKDSIPEEYNNRIIKQIRPDWVMWKMEVVI